MGGSVIMISSEGQFQQLIGGNKVAVVDFTAAWCGPCKMVAPRFEALAAKVTTVSFLKVDVDEQPEISQKHGVSAMPTFIFFKNGAKLDQVVGADIAKVEALVNKYAADSDPFPSGGGYTLASSGGTATGGIPTNAGPRASTAPGNPFKANSDRAQLIDMGFDPARVDAALKATNGRGLQPAMDWLFSHADDVIPAADDSATAAAASSSSSSSSSAAPQGDTPMGEAQNDDAITEAEATAQSLKCDDCGRLLRDPAAAEFHAVKTGHQNFSESTQAIKPLTEEEKKAKLEMLRAKLAAKKEEKRLQEIEEGKAKEKVRRTTGKELTEIKERLAEQEMRKAAEAKKREKEADRIAKEKIKAQIEADKRDRAARLEKEKLERQGLKAQVAASSAPAPAAAAAAGPRDYTEARIQLRLPTGGSLTQVFKSADLLSVVYDHVVAQTGAAAGSFKLVQAFPRKVLDDQSKSLKELGLAPSAALVVQ